MYSKIPVYIQSPIYMYSKILMYIQSLVYMYSETLAFTLKVEKYSANEFSDLKATDRL